MTNQQIQILRDLLGKANVISDREEAQGIYSQIREILVEAKNGYMDVLTQACDAPVYDGDVASKQARDGLLALGLIVKVAFNNEQGYQAATYSGWSVLNATPEIKATQRLLYEC